MSMLIAGVQYVTTKQGAAELGVWPHVIQNWANRGLVTAAERLPDGRPVYRLDDLWDVERDTRGRGRPRSSTLPGGEMIQ